jgi:hypothetical protein
MVDGELIGRADVARLCEAIDAAQVQERPL